MREQPAGWSIHTPQTVAVGHTILTIVYHVLTEGTSYQDLGPQFVDERDRQRVERRLVHRLEALGYKVAPEPVAA